MSLIKSSFPIQKTCQKILTIFTYYFGAHIWCAMQMANTPTPLQPYTFVLPHATYCGLPYWKYTCDEPACCSQFTKVPQREAEPCIVFSPCLFPPPPPNSYQRVALLYFGASYFNLCNSLKHFVRAE